MSKSINEVGTVFEEIQETAKEVEQKVFNDLIDHLKIEYEMGILDDTLKTISNMCIGELNDYLADDISYAAEDSE